MGLAPFGEYNIVTQATGQSVGRHLAEDRSLAPKRIAVLEQSSDTWTVKRVSPDLDDQFILTIRGSPTARIDSLVFGILLESPEPTVWYITEASDKGRDVYTIALADDTTRGWVAPLSDEDSDQIAVKRLDGNITEYFVITPAY